MTTRQANRSVGAELLKVLLGLALIGVVIASLGSNPERDQREQVSNEFWRLLASLSVTDVQQLEICPENSTCKSINSQEQLSAFVQIMRSAQGYFPNHPKYAQEFYVTLLLKSNEKFEFLFYLYDRPDTNVDISFIKKQGAGTYYFGDARASTSTLYEWLRAVGVIN